MGTCLYCHLFLLYFKYRDGNIIKYLIRDNIIGGVKYFNHVMLSSPNMIYGIFGIDKLIHGAYNIMNDISVPRCYSHNLINKYHINVERADITWSEKNYVIIFPSIF